MPKAKRALDAFTRLRVDLILGGHLHRAYIGNSLDVHPGADRARGVVIVQSGTTTSARGRAREHQKNSFNVIRIGARALEITHHMLFAETGRFEPFSVHAFPRRKEQWFERGTIAWPLGGAVDAEAGADSGAGSDIETDLETDVGADAEVMGR